MKSTGIVRRIDDLGRVVIPKELRRTLKIEDGDPLEFYVEDDKIILKRYLPDGELDSIKKGLLNLDALSKEERDSILERAIKAIEGM